MSTRIRSRPASSQFPSSQAGGIDSSGEPEVWNKICTELRKLPEFAALNENAKIAISKLDVGSPRVGGLEIDGEDTVDDGSEEGEGIGIKVEDHEDPRVLLAKLDQLKELSQKQLDYAQSEKKILDQASEDVSILTALRQATETVITDNKRKKRKADETPLVETSKNFKKARSGSAAPMDVPSIGAQVAFRLKKQKGAEVEWIQCEITKVIGEGNKIRFEVQDPEPDENNNPGQSYKAGPKDIIFIPESSTDLPVYPIGTRVLARYPETTTFYKAEVMGTKRDGTCRLKFEGEEEVGKETEVERRLVLEMPK
ncbi:SGF29 tudor-like domain-containing protein [Lipomyces chichibuensis]|uniref:SGF29 tudor-like domain-containing protein n=1 Tax=Lipomyces chichibuensis TaxID=1546026 RepID=UPI0033437C6A